MHLFADCNTGSDKLIARLKEIISDPEYPVLTAAVGVVKDGNVAFSDAVGWKQPGGDAATGDTKYRIASISKLITAIGVWQLIEQGLIDPDADVCRYLGFQLRNPAYPDTPITVKMLLSHTSSIRDGGKPGSYNIPCGHPISDFFTEDSPYYNPNCWAPAGEAPGVFFTYCNMNYCLLGTGQKLPFAGHTAEAYGLVGGMAFDRERGNGIVYFVAGLGCDMAKSSGVYSALYRFEEALLTASADFARFDY